MWDADVVGRLRLYPTIMNQTSWLSKAVRLAMNLRCLLLAFWVTCSLVGMSGCGWCDESIQSVATSPDGHYEAVLENENCGGAASALTFDVMIYRLPRHDSHWPWMSSPRKPVFLASYAYHLKLEWANKSRLTISCPGCTGVDVHHLEPSWEGIAVQYVQPSGQQAETHCAPSAETWRAIRLV